jgi:hypothetical protein
MTRSGEKLYGNWDTSPPRKPLSFWWWLAFATIARMLVVAVWRGEW